VKTRTRFTRQARRRATQCSHERRPPRVHLLRRRDLQGQLQFTGRHLTEERIERGRSVRQPRVKFPARVGRRQPSQMIFSERPQLVIADLRIIERIAKESFQVHHGGTSQRILRDRPKGSGQRYLIVAAREKKSFPALSISKLRQQVSGMAMTEPTLRPQRNAGAFGVSSRCRQTNGAAMPVCSLPQNLSFMPLRVSSILPQNSFAAMRVFASHIQ